MNENEKNELENEIDINKIVKDILDAQTKWQTKLFNINKCVLDMYDERKNDKGLFFDGFRAGLMYVLEKIRKEVMK